MSNHDMSEVKACPQCGQVLFADMDVCYGCLHNFERKGEPVVGQAFAKAETTRRVHCSPQASAHAQGAAATHEERAEYAAKDDVNSSKETLVVDAQDDLKTRPSEALSFQVKAASRTPASDEVPQRSGIAQTPHVPQVPHASQPPHATQAPDVPQTPHASQPAGMAAPASDMPHSLELSQNLGMVQVSMPEQTACTSSFSEKHPSDMSLALRVQTVSMDVVVPLPSSGLSVGRSPDNDVVLHCEAVSRCQLRLEPSEGGVTVIDLGATNPVFFRGHVAPPELAIAAGDAIDVCGTLMTLIRT